MATDAVNAEYLADALDFAADLAENGRLASFGNVGAADPLEPWKPSGGFVETGKAYIFPSVWKQDFSDDVKSDDLMFFASAETDLSTCRKMIDDGLTYSIVKALPFKPDTDVIFYEIQVRR